MNEILLALILSLIVFKGAKMPEFLALGLFLRIFLAILHHKLGYNLPDSGDGFGFLRMINAFASSMNPIDAEGVKFVSSIWFYPALIAKLATVLSVNPYFFALSLNILYGLLIQKKVINYIFRKNNFNPRSNVSLLLLVFSTTLAVYSANLLREVYIVYFLVCASIIVLDQDRNEFLDFLKVLFFIMIASIFHIGVIIILPVYVYFYVKRGVVGRLGLITFIVLFVYTAIYLKIGFAKIEGIYNFIDGKTTNLSFREAYDERLESRGDTYFFASYMKTLSGQIFFIIPKYVEYLIRPTFVDIKGNYEFFKAIENLIFLLLYIRILINFRALSLGGRSVFISLSMVLLIYGLYSGEMSQGHRHKFKVYPLIIMLYSAKKIDENSIHTPSKY